MMPVNYKANDKIYELYDFCIINGFKAHRNNDDMMSNYSSTVQADKGAVRIWADSFLNKFRLVMSTGATETCSLTDLQIKGGSLFINGKEFVI